MLLEVVERDDVVGLEPVEMEPREGTPDYLMSGIQHD